MYGFLPWPLKRSQIKKIRSLYTTNWMILFWLPYTTFLISEILKNFCWFFGQFEDTKRTFWNIAFPIFLLLRLLADTGSLIIRPLSFWNRRCYHNGFNYSVISSQSPNRQIPCHQMAYFAQPIWLRDFLVFLFYNGQFPYYWDA